MNALICIKYGSVKFPHLKLACPQASMKPKFELKLLKRNKNSAQTNIRETNGSVK